MKDEMINQSTSDGWLLKYLNEWLIGQGLADTLAEITAWIIVIAGILLAAWISNWIAKRIVLKVVSYVVRKSKTKWDDALEKRKVFARFSHLAPILIIYLCAGMLPDISDQIKNISIIYTYLLSVLIINGFLNAVVDIYHTYDISREKPIKGYIQVVQIIIFVFVAILVISKLLGKSPIGILTGLGALTAVLILVFKDTILGLVASLQLSFNDMVRRGDWIEMPKYGADGDVIDVTLHTVKVQNWDKTISTIPTYALMADSFKNWRGMSESGGRRIKRSVHIDMTSIKFCDETMLERFSKIQYISEYLKEKQAELETYNKEKKIDFSSLVNGRRLTNIGTFRAYLVQYLRNHPRIHKNMTFLVRQLKPTEKGLPIEIYVFSNDQVWANYEAIQADIFDHVLAIIPEFDLRIFQHPTGNDFQQISELSNK